MNQIRRIEKSNRSVHDLLYTCIYAILIACLHATEYIVTIGITSSIYCMNTIVVYSMHA